MYVCNLPVYMYMYVHVIIVILNILYNVINQLFEEVMQVVNCLSLPPIPPPPSPLPSSVPPSLPPSLPSPLLPSCTHHLVWTMAVRLVSFSSSSPERSSTHTTASLSTRPTTRTQCRSVPPQCSSRTTWTGSGLQAGWWGWWWCRASCWTCSSPGLSTRPS